jgi:hypothetical protein
LVAPTGLRAARREQAAARRAAKPAPAKKAAGKAPAKATSRSSPGSSAKKAPAKTGTPKLRWTVVKEHANGKEQTAVFGGGELAIVKAGEAWRAVYRKGSSETVLAEGGFGRAYTACTSFTRGAAK